MKKKTVSAITMLPGVLIAGAVLLFYLSGDGRYRYPCQDPINFADPSCSPPECIASETCTNMLIDLGDTQ